ncbi:hypothetical protein SDC9_07471 [bioreactor metagenome]|uniref:Uncharacterized protein n=1 Tax=bioreactor metagenome TaxID=1076179 RepID=A0A644T6S9_9ZZZZ|nr:hypothetical protein [Methanobrevibacter sp.]MEA4956927.1 hypothetical protein [Methanobrevibacter sp.]
MTENKYGLNSSTSQFITKFYNETGIRLDVKDEQILREMLLEFSKVSFELGVNTGEVVK